MRRQTRPPRPGRPRRGMHHPPRHPQPYRGYGRRRNNNMLGNMVGSATGAYVGSKMAQSSRPQYQQPYDQPPVENYNNQIPYQPQPRKNKSMGILGVIGIIIILWLVLSWLLPILFPYYYYY